MVQYMYIYEIVLYLDTCVYVYDIHVYKTLKYTHTHKPMYPGKTCRVVHPVNCTKQYVFYKLLIHNSPNCFYVFSILS